MKRISPKQTTNPTHVFTRSLYYELSELGVKAGKGLHQGMDITTLDVGFRPVCECLRLCTSVCMYACMRAWVLCFVCVCMVRGMGGGNQRWFVHVYARVCARVFVPARASSFVISDQARNSAQGKNRVYVNQAAQLGQSKL